VRLINQVREFNSEESSLEYSSIQLPDLNLKNYEFKLSTSNSSASKVFTKSRQQLSNRSVLLKSFINNDAIPHVTFTSNPARVRFYSQEIVLFREDLSIRLGRRAILTPIYSLEGENRPIRGTQHMSETVLRQGHLCPVPLTAQPIFWELDYFSKLFIEE
jgi:hypothetical protein